MKKIIILLYFITVQIWAQQSPAPNQSKTILITGGTAHVGNGKVIENALISIQNGKIYSIQDGRNVKPARHDIYIDAFGKHIYPGFITPNSTLGLGEIDEVRASIDESETGTFNPHIRSIIAYNSESKVSETARPNGVLLAQITPRGGRISGTSSIVQLDAWNWEDALIKENDGIHLKWPNIFNRSVWWAEPGGFEINKKYEEQIKEIQSFFDQSFNYIQSNITTKDIPYEAMRGLQDGTKTLYIQTNGEKEIIDAILFKKKNKINKMVIVGGYYAYFVADELKENNISVLLKRIHDLPMTDDEDVNLPYKTAKLLFDKGILVGLENSGDSERMQTRNLPFYAGTCAAWGLTKEQALQLITSNTAKILGIDNLYGTLEDGKSATLFISEGDALDMKGNLISHAFIDGREISLETHQTELYKKYKEKYNKKKL